MQELILAPKRGIKQSSPNARKMTFKKSTDCFGVTHTGTLGADEVHRTEGLASITLIWERDK